MQTLKPFLFSKDNRKVIVSSTVSIVLALLVYWLLPLEDTGIEHVEGARRAAFIFTIAAMFWALEVIPLYATSMLVVLLNIFLLARPGGVMEMTKSGYKQFLNPLASTIIILFFGGFAVARAVSKFHLDRAMARWLMGKLGSNPLVVLLGLMGCTGFLSMWMSNTATTAMMIAMLGPLLGQLDKTDRYRSALVLGIPFAANLGGIGTPVGTPPNAIAIGMLETAGIQIDFFRWVIMAFPLACILTLVAGLILFMLFRPATKTIQFHIPAPEPQGHQGKLCALIGLSTVVLWLTSSFHHMPSALVALLAAGLYAMTGILTREDFKQLDWDILLLMWGGLSLGVALEITGLTDWLVGLDIFNQQGVALVVISCFMAMIMSTFMSNTATSNLVIPVMIAMPIGESNQITLAVTVALSCSFAMALPVSTPPNAIAYSTDAIKSRDMIKSGTIVSVLSVIVVLLGYQLILPGLTR